MTLRSYHSNLAHKNQFPFLFSIETQSQSRLPLRAALPSKFSKIHPFIPLIFNLSFSKGITLSLSDVQSRSMRPILPRRLIIVTSPLTGHVLPSYAKEFECSKRGTRRYPDRWLLVRSVDNQGRRFARSGALLLLAPTHPPYKEPGLFSIRPLHFLPENASGYLSCPGGKKTLIFASSWRGKWGADADGILLHGVWNETREKRGSLNAILNQTTEIRNCASLLPVYYCVSSSSFCFFLREIQFGSRDVEWKIDS